MLLAYVAEHRHGEDAPPEGRDEERDLASRRDRDGQNLLPGKKNDRNADDKRNRAPYIPDRKSAGRHLIHPFVVGDVHEEGIVEHIGARRAYRDEHITDEQQLPTIVRNKREQRGGDDTEQAEAGKKRFFEPLVIGNRAQDRA